MARIQEYLPEQEAQGPVGGTSPALEAVGQFGEGISRLGRSTTELADVIESRTAMMESADAQAQVSETKADFFNRVKDETNRGVLDQGKLLDEYDNWVGKTGANFNTPRGRAEFERASSRTRGSLIRWAAQGSAQISGANALADHTNTINNLTNITQQDPHSYADNRGALDELYAGYKDDPNMNKNPMALEKMYEADKANLAVAAFRGQANQDFDSIVQDMVGNGGKVDPTNPRYNVAANMLKSGVYDDVLDASHKTQLIKEARANFTAAQTEGQRVINVQEAQQAQQTEKWEQQAIPKWANNNLSVKEVINSPMDAKDKVRWVHMVQAAQAKELKTDPQVMNDISERILSADNEPGHISDSSQLSEYVGSGISVDDYNKLRNLIGNSKQGEVDRNNEKQLMDMAKAKLVNANPLAGIKDPDGQYKLMLFSSALQQAKQEAVKEGKTVSSVLDPNSKDFFGNRIQQYVASPQDILKRQADAMRGTIAQPTNIQTQPGTLPTTGAPTEQETVTMYKNGVARQIYKSKQKEAEAKGYSVK